MKKTIQQFVLAAVLLLLSNQMQAQLEPPFVIGKDTLGGKVAYIDATGQHGLIVAASDQASLISWYEGANVETGVTGTAFGTGNSNTEALVAKLGQGRYAARLCYDLVLNGYSDWYLPSKDELNHLFIYHVPLGIESSGYYWSSSEYNTGYAWEQNLKAGGQNYYRKSGQHYVRAVRTF